MTPTDWVRPDIRELSAYAVPDASGMVKLDAMENPYRWPAEMLDAWLAEVRELELNRYPDPSARALQSALREAMNVPAGADLLLGNGSDEIIQLLAMALRHPDTDKPSVLLAPDPSFVMYRMIAQFVGMEYVGVPLADDFGLDVAAMTAAIQQHEPALVFIAQPNNPTGNIFAEDDLRAIIEAASGWVVIDEAYAPFTDRDCMPWLTEYPNLLVMRTVSKMGLAGLRLGLLAAAPEMIHEIDKLRLPYNINVLTQLSARFALEHPELFAQQAADIRRDRKVLMAALEALPGLHVYPSEANFILFSTPAGQARNIHAGLRDAGVLIKCLDGAHPRLADCLRVTVGSEAENKTFLQALKPLL